MVSCLLIYFIALSLYHSAWVCFRRNIFYTMFTTSSVTRGFFRLVEAIFIFVGPFVVLGVNMMLMYKVMGTVSSVESFFGKNDWTAGWLEFTFVLLDLFLIWLLVILWLGIDTVWTSRSIAVSDEPPRSPALKVSDACCEFWVWITSCVEALIPKDRSRRRNRSERSMEQFYSLMTVVKVVGPAAAIVLYFLVPNHSHLHAYYVSGGLASAVCLSAVLASISSGTGKIMVFLDRLGSRLDDQD